MPEVSVVIPTLGDECVKGAVESAREQTIDTEVIVVDDGDEVLNLDVDTYIRPNSGSVGAARNRGVEAASSDYIAFLDDDDRWDPVKCEKQIARLEYTGADVVTCNHADTSGIHRFKLTSGFEQLKQVSLGVPSSILTRRAVPESVPFADLGVWEEREWYSRILETYRAVGVDHVLTTYDDSNEGSISGSTNAIVREGIPMIRRRAIELGEDPDEAVAWAHRRLSIILHKESRVESLKHSLLAVRHDPEWPMFRSVIRSILGPRYHTLDRYINRIRDN
ncbi:MAG: glycosyltransferase family 2 protein [Halorhabdus sp.]